MAAAARSSTTTLYTRRVRGLGRRSGDASRRDGPGGGEPSDIYGFILLASAALRARAAPPPLGAGVSHNELPTLYGTLQSPSRASDDQYNLMSFFHDFRASAQRVKSAREVKCASWRAPQQAAHTP